MKQLTRRSILAGTGALALTVPLLSPRLVRAKDTAA